MFSTLERSVIINNIFHVFSVIWVLLWVLLQPISLVFILSWSEKKKKSSFDVFQENVKCV